MATTATTSGSAGAPAVNEPNQRTAQPQSTPSSTLQAGADAVNKLSARTDVSHASVMRAVRLIGGGIIGIAVLVVVLNEIFSLDAIENSTGQFDGVIGSLETTGAAALGLLVIGFLVLAANQIMGFFGGGGF